MKRKQWIAGLLSLAALGLVVEQASAWGFWRHRCCGHKYGTYICCRPYNAFTPVCFGNMVCDGCCPSFNGGGFHGGGFHGGGWGAHCGAPSFGPHAFAGPMMPPQNFAGYPGYPYLAGSEPTQEPPPASMPPATTPAPTPANVSYGPPPYGAPYGAPYYAPPQYGFAQNAYGVQPANYPPGVYPGYWPAFPMGYWTSAYAPAPAQPGVPYGR